MSSSFGEHIHEPIPPDFSNETIQQQILDYCISEAVAYTVMARTFDQSTPFLLDDALAGIAQVTDRLDVANEIAHPERRLVSMAGIARRTENHPASQAVQQETIATYSNDTSALARITIALGDPAILESIADPTKRDSVAWTVGVALEDSSILATITDPQKRDTALQTIIIHTTNDFRDFMHLLPEDKAQQALASRALKEQDSALAQEIADIPLRVQTLLKIARCPGARGVDTNILELIPDIQTPHTKATYLKEYMDLSEQPEPAHDLYDAAQQIEEPIVRAYFMAAVVARTGNVELAAEIEKTLEEHRDQITSAVRNSIYAGLARGLGDLKYVHRIYDEALHRKTREAVILKTHDTENAIAIGDTTLLSKLVLTHTDIDLAVRLCASDTVRLQTCGQDSLVQIAVQSQSMDPILRVPQAWKRDRMLIEYLVKRDDLDEVERVENAWVRTQALTQIAKQRLDFELAYNIGDNQLAADIERQLLASTGGDTLRYEDIALLDNPRTRIMRYYDHFASNPDVRANIEACIREQAPGQRYGDLYTLCRRTRDPLLAYEALYDMQNRINSTQMILHMTEAMTAIRTFSNS